MTWFAGSRLGVTSRTASRGGSSEGVALKLEDVGAVGSCAGSAVPKGRGSEPMGGNSDPMGGSSDPMGNVGSISS